MQSVFTMLPELESIRCEAMAAPEFGSRYVATFELFIERAHSFFEFIATDNHAALCAGVRTELTAARASREVDVGFGRRHFLNGPFDANLSTEWLAVPEDRGERVLLEFESLSRFVVRVPADRSVINVTKKNHPRTRLAVGCRRRDRHAVAFNHYALRVVEPTAELDERIRIAVRKFQRSPRNAHETSANCQFGVAERSNELGPS